jgi:hypothetical protein
VASLNPSRPEPTEYVPALGNYVDLVPETDILAALEGELEETLSCLRAVSEEVALIRHAPYTWTIKQVLGHIIDSERVFADRALRFARRDAAELPGFDENDYALHALSDDFPLAELVEEFEHLRRSHVGFFRHLHADDWDCSGIANKNRVTVRALAYAIVGHERHHMRIVRKRLAGAS